MHDTDCQAINATNRLRSASTRTSPTTLAAPAGPDSATTVSSLSSNLPPPTASTSSSRRGSYHRSGGAFTPMSVTEDEAPEVEEPADYFTAGSDEDGKTVGGGARSSGELARFESAFSTLQHSANHSPAAVESPPSNEAGVKVRDMAHDAAAEGDNAAPSRQASGTGSYLKGMMDRLRLGGEKGAEG